MGKKEEGYVPGPDFKQDWQEPLFDIQMNDNTELWLVQLPDDHLPDFNGQEISLDFDQDELGSIKGSDGKLYSLVNFPADVAETTIFQSSPSGTSIVGNISRHVSLVHFPEPEELESVVSGSKKSISLSSKTSYTKSHFSTPVSTSKKKGQSGSKSRSISRKSSLSEVGEPSGLSSKSAQNSERTQGSGITISGSSEQSHRKKPKVKA